MKAVITADIINSSQVESSQWINPLKESLSNFGEQGKYWEIYRGDELQIVLDEVQNAFAAAVRIKAELKKESMDARISIGIGEVNFIADNVKESNGTAFIFSGRNLEEMKKGKSQSLSIRADNVEFDENFNLIFQLMEPIFEKWTPSAAKSVLYAVENPNLNQIEIAEKMGISQGAFSRALKRANFESIQETDSYFRKKSTLFQ